MADCLAHMQRGAELIKVRPNVRQFRRHFSLDADYSYLRWTPTNKKPHKARSLSTSLLISRINSDTLVAVDSIKEIRVGRNTEVLRASEACLNDMQVYTAVENCFLYRNADYRKSALFRSSTATTTNALTWWRIAPTRRTYGLRG